MKFTSTPFLVITFILFFVTSLNISAQNTDTENMSKEELKLMKLEEKVKRAQDKIDATNLKLAQADSLMDAGIAMENEANSELDVISSEEKQYVKEKSEEYKTLKKQLRKADKDEYKTLERELKSMKSAYDRGLKEFDKRYKAEVKKLDKGKLNQQKAKEKLKQYKPKLKEYEERLEEAETQLEEFKQEGED